MNVSSRLYPLYQFLRSDLVSCQTLCLGARPRYSLVLDEDVKKPTKQTALVSRHSLRQYKRTLFSIQRLNAKNKAVQAPTESNNYAERLMESHVSIKDEKNGNRFCCLRCHVCKCEFQPEMEINANQHLFTTARYIIYQRIRTTQPKPS